MTGEESWWSRDDIRGRESLAMPEEVSRGCRDEE